MLRRPLLIVMALAAFKAVQVLCKQSGVAEALALWHLWLQVHVLAHTSCLVVHAQSEIDQLWPFNLTSCNVLLQ